jgi:hypothetical protein
VIEGNVILEHIFKDNFQGKKFWILVECHPSSVPAYSGTSDETPSFSRQYRVR